MLRGICNSVNIIRQTVERIESKVDILIELAEYIKKTVDIISLRQIEESLASCTVLVSLYLPQAFGGHLETVVQLVEQLIDQSKAAGLPTCNAQAVCSGGATECSFTVTQTVCVKVPLTFGADATVGQAGIDCGEPSLTDICTNC